MNQNTVRRAEKSEQSWRFPRFSRKSSAKQDTVKDSVTLGLSNTTTLKTKNPQFKSPSQNVTKPSPHRTFSIPPPAEHESFTSTVTRSLPPNGHIDWAFTSSLEPAIAPSNGKLTAPSSSQHTKKLDISCSQTPSLSPSTSIKSRTVNDRRKLNTKELKLQLDTALTFQQKDCEMIRSGERAFRSESCLSNQNELPKGKTRNANMKPTSNFVQEHGHGLPLTPDSTTEKSKAEEHKMGTGLLTPPSSLRRNSEEQTPPARSRDYLQTPPSSPSYSTPPLTPIDEPRADENLLKFAVHSSSNRKALDALTSTSLLSPSPVPSSRASLDLSSRSSSRIKRTLSLRSKTKSSETRSSPRRSNSLNSRRKTVEISRPVDREIKNTIQDDSFMNPRPLSRAEKCVVLPKTASATTNFGVRALVLPAAKIARAIGFSIKDAGERTKSNSGSEEDLTDKQFQRSISPTPSARPSIDQTSIMSSYRPSVKNFSRLSSFIKHPNSPTSPSFGQKLTAISTPAEEASSPFWSYNSSTEHVNVAHSEPVSAFEDDSSEEECFGELKQIPGIGGIRNLRRKKASSRRQSKDSYFSDSAFQSDRSSSRLFIPRPRSSDSPRDSVSRRVSVENFTPLREDVIMEEGNIVLDIFTEEARLKIFGTLGNDQVVHIKDDDTFDHIVFERQDGKTCAVAGTMECLLSELCNPLGTFQDENFLDIFIRTFALFGNVCQVVNALIAHFREGSASTQQRILSMFSQWLCTQPEDILENEDATDMLSVFLGEASSSGHFASSGRLLRQFSLMKEKLISYKVTIESGSFLSFDAQLQYVCCHSKTSCSTAFPFDERVPVLQVAQYLSALDLILFRDASQMRTLCLWWNSQTIEQQQSWTWTSEITFNADFGNTYIDRVTRFLRRGLMLKYWALTEILQAQTTETKSDVILKMIELATDLRKLGNFQSMLCIVEALASESISSLEKSWDLVPVGKVHDFADMKALLDHKTYAFESSRSTRLIIPYFPFFIKGIANMLNQTTHVSFRYNDASKVHVDHTMESCGYARRLTNVETTRTMPILIDFKKYMMVAIEVARYRNCVRRNYSFSSSLSKSCLALSKLYIPSRLAFSRNSIILPTASSTAEGFATQHSLDTIGELIERKMLLTWSKKVDVKQEQAHALLLFLQRAASDAQPSSAESSQAVAIPTTTSPST